MTRRPRAAKARAKPARADASPGKRDQKGGDGVAVATLYGLVLLMLLAALRAIPAGAVEPPAPLVLVASDANPLYTNPQHDGLVDHLVLEVFRRLQIPVAIDHLPSERAVQSADGGVVDGDILRIGGLSRLYPHLVQVPEPWLEMTFVAFTRRDEVVIRRWEDLAPWHVAAIKGWKVFENNVKAYRQYDRVNGAASLFAMLGKGRVDVILYDHRQGEYLAQHLGMSDVRVAGPPLTVEPIYLYLNQRHRGLVDQVAVTLKGIKEDGTYRRLLGEEPVAVRVREPSAQLAGEGGR